MIYIIVAILMFGVIIALHELGHFATAKLFGVRVNEFSIGMGPALLKRQKGETLYSVRALPVGGYCAMEGEDEESSDPRAFGNTAWWKKIIILSAGSAMNLLTGFVLVLILFSRNNVFLRPAIQEMNPGFGLENCGLQAGDVVHSVDGHRVYFYGNLGMLLGRAGEDVDWVVERNGELVELNDVHMPLQEVKLEDGRTVYQRGLLLNAVEVPATVPNILKYSWYGTIDFIRMVWMSLGDLLSGAAGLHDVAGPVGIVNLISEVGSESPTTSAAAYNITYFAALIAVNLAVMNMLPLPALDGGRIFFLLINGILYGLFRKKIDPKYEAYVHMAGLVLLLGLMLLVTFGDVRRLLGR